MRNFNFSKTQAIRFFVVLTLLLLAACCNTHAATFSGTVQSIRSDGAILVRSIDDPTADSEWIRLCDVEWPEYAHGTVIRTMIETLGKNVEISWDRTDACGNLLSKVSVHENGSLLDLNRKIESLVRCEMLLVDPETYAE